MDNKRPPYATHQGTPCRCLVIGTDTEVGKTYVTATIVHGLRLLQRRVWIHKPIACGGWDGTSSADGRALRALCLPPQGLDTVCPQEFAPECSPHVALRLAGQRWTMDDLLASYDRCDHGDHDLVVEGAGGLLAPLTSDDQDIASLAVARNLPTVIVTRPHLGTLNHTRLTVAVARQRGMALLGLVINYHQPASPGPAHDSAAKELERLCNLPILASIGHQAGSDAALAKRLAHAILPSRRPPLP